MRRTILSVTCTTALAVLAACGGSGSLTTFGNVGLPDTLVVEPALPLVLPPSTALPPPGGPNRADPD